MKPVELALQELSRRHPNIKNRVALEVEEAVVELALEQPAWRPICVSNELKKEGVSVFPAGVRCVWHAPIKGGGVTVKLLGKRFLIVYLS